MKLIVGNASALHYWRSSDGNASSIGSNATIARLKDTISTQRQLTSIEPLPMDFGDPPLHVLTDARSRRPASSKIACHVCTEELPRESFRKLSDHVFVVSPELSFLEMSSQMDLPTLLEYGFFLCGTYSIGADGSLSNDRPPLTRHLKLEHFINRSHPRRGSSAALRALRFVADGSASPRESKLAIMLCLPLHYGGFGFPKPVMNHKVTLTEMQAQQFGRKSMYIDLFWPDQNVGIEYDGRAYHATDSQLSNDRKKSNQLIGQGITIMRIDNLQISNLMNMETLARSLARLMKRRLRLPSENQALKRAQLYRSLFQRRSMIEA